MGEESRHEWTKTARRNNTSLKMALHVPRAPGFASMMKDGAKHYSGLEEAVFRNISACKEFSTTLKTAYGPRGRNKMVINHLEKLFVTNDAATIIRELEIEHPAAKLIVLASQMQEQEMGDGTNWVVMFAGALLEYAEDLIKMGLTPTDWLKDIRWPLIKLWRCYLNSNAGRSKT